jgi:HD-like signal output (HDOD) protein
MIAVEKKKAPLVLFMEDDGETVSYLRKILLIERYKQVYFSSAQEALQFLEISEVNLIVCNLNLPDMNSEEFLRKAAKVSSGSIKLISGNFREKAQVLDLLAKGYGHYYLLKPWADDDLRNILNKFCSINADVDKNKIQKYISAFSKLPAPTQMTWNLNRMLDEENININKITREIEFHPFLAAKILQIANSVSYGARKEIVSIRNAVILIGLRQLKALVISFQLLNAFSNAVDKRFEKNVNQFWQDSLKKALIAKKIADAWNTKVDKDLIFISTLLSNIGYLVWLYSVPEDYSAYLLMSKQKLMTVSEAEQFLFFFEHTKLGAILLKLWNIPSKVIDAVENHHSREAKDDVTKIMQAADYLDGSDDNFPHDSSIDGLALKFRDKIKDLVT